MPEVLLHVGMDKTGSTSIQHSFEGYDDGTLAYARLASSNHSMPVQMLFRDPDRPTRAIRAQGLDLDEILAQRALHQADLETALDGRHDKVLISAEGVLGLKSRQLDDLYAFLSARSTRIRVMAYVREPMGYASSAFQQGLKAGSHTFHVPRPRYAARLGEIESVFGRENITYLRFDPKRFPNGSVVLDFASQIGARPERINEQRINESLTQTSAAALYLFNRERQNHAGSRAYFRARVVLIRLLMREDARQQRRAKALAAEQAAKRSRPGAALAGLIFNGSARPAPTEAELRTAKFRFAPSLVHASVMEDDIAWMERRSGLDLMPPDPERDGSDDDGIRSEEHLLDLAASAGSYLMPIADRFKVTPANDSALAVMNAVFEKMMDQGARPES